MVDEHAAGSQRAAPPRTRRLGPKPVPRPDPAAGVFETLLVLDGHPVGLERHLNRLGSSLRALYDAAPPADLEHELQAAASRLECGRMRVNVRPQAGDISTDVELTAPVKRRIPVRLRTVTVPGGLGAHKWIDRRLLEALAADTQAEPLLCDLDGQVLEAARANVFVVEDGCVATPPADGRILPGMTRGQVLELAGGLGLDVRVEPIDLRRLARADEIFVTGAIGGVEPAQLERRGASDATVTAQLARAWRSWARLAAGSRNLLTGVGRLPA